VRKTKIFLSLGGTLVMVFIMGSTGKPLKTPATPGGILHLEFAYNQQKAEAILQAWSTPVAALNTTGTTDMRSKINQAKINTWWDFLFLFFYSYLFYTLCFFVYEQFKPSRFGNAGRQLAKLSIIAGLLDIVENIFMFSVLNHTYVNWYLPIMVFVSSLKWLLVAVILLYCLIGFGKLALKNRH
jgi:hypothetical protein